MKEVIINDPVYFSRYEGELQSRVLAKFLTTRLGMFTTLRHGINDRNWGLTDI
jgi:hypothetical protein